MLRLYLQFVQATAGGGGPRSAIAPRRTRVTECFTKTFVFKAYLRAAKSTLDTILRNRIPLFPAILSHGQLDDSGKVG